MELRISINRNRSACMEVSEEMLLDMLKEELIAQTGPRLETLRLTFPEYTFGKARLISTTPAHEIEGETL